MRSTSTTSAVAELVLGPAATERHCSSQPLNAVTFPFPCPEHVADYGLIFTGIRVSMLRA